MVFNIYVIYVGGEEGRRGSNIKSKYMILLHEILKGICFPPSFSMITKAIICFMYICNICIPLYIYLLYERIKCIRCYLEYV